MLILVVCRVAADVDEAELRHLIPAEMAALGELKAGGVLADAWSPGRPGAVLMLDVPGPAEGAGIAAALPLAQAGLITTEIIPLYPLNL